MLTQTTAGSKQVGSFWQRLDGHSRAGFALSGYFLLLLAVSWRRWLSPIADSGRELDLPRRLLEGELLYRDVHYLYGPLAPHLKAFLFSLFGERLDVLQASGIFASLVILLLVYTIAQRLLGRGEAALAVATVTLYCVFKPGGNLISPYSYAALYALVLSLGSLQAMIVHIESGRVGHLLLAGLLTGLAAVTKQEFALASAAAALAAALSVAGRDGRFDMSRVRELTRKLLIFALPALVVVVPVYGFFFSKAGWQTMVEDCHILYTHLPAPMIFYNARRAGLDQPGLSLLQLTGGGMVLALLCGLLLILAEPAIIRRHSAKVALGFLGAIGGIAVIRLIVGTQWDGSPLRFMPVLLAMVIIGAWRKDPVRMIVAVFSLALLARVALRVPSGGAFGSFFLPGALIVLIWFLFRWLPVWAERAGVVGRPDRLRRVIAIAVLLALTVTTFVYAVRYRRTYSYLLETPRGSYYVPASVGPVIQQTLEAISSTTRPGDPVVVVPEGSDLTFMIDRHHPLRHQILIPGLMSTADEVAAAATIERLKVERILVVNRPMREFGLTSFGEDFYQRLGGWIVEHYDPVATLGADGDPTVRIGDPRFFIRIYARRNTSAPQP